MAAMPSGSDCRWLSATLRVCRAYKKHLDSSNMCCSERSRQTALERQDLPCTYLARHEAESIKFVVISMCSHAL